jgi:hypothetical protein
MKVVTKLAAVTIALLAASIICFVGATYLLSSNTVNITVTPQATMSLSANATSVVSGVSAIELTATISDNSPGITVTFLQDGVSIGTANTDGAGTAKFVTGILTASHAYTATATHP